MAFEIAVLGDLTVRCDGVAVSLPQSRKTRALLAYLAVQSKPQRRERLCEMFWDVPDDPRGALRWSLSKLRQILNADGEARLTADRNSVELKSGSVRLDYELVRGLSPDTLASLSTDRLEAITGAYAGPFLADLYLPHCPAFEAWRVYCANETEIVRLKALRALVDRLADEPQRALAYLHALQSLQPDEDLVGEIALANDRARHSATGRANGSGASAAALPEPAASRSLVDPWQPVPAQPASARQRIDFTKGHDGARLAYGVSGSGPAIVRASHWMSHLEFEWESPVWGHWIDAFSSGFTFVRYDGRLNGLSDTEATDITFDAFVSDLEHVVEAAGLERFVLLGISQGCAISIEYAKRHPDKVAGLVFCGGFLHGWRARGNPTEIARREAIGVLMRQGWGQDDPMFRQMFTNLFIPGANRVQMDWFNELQRKTLTPENAVRLNSAFADIDISRTTELLHVPTLVMHANGDRVVPISEGQEIARRIAGARFIELDSTNHILLAEEPAFRTFIVEASSFASEVLQARAKVPVDPRTRRQATVLCAEFRYAELEMDALSPEVALERLDSFLANATALVRNNGGTVLSISENELMASFGAPEPLEGHAALACRTALALRELALGTEAALQSFAVALDTGTVIVGPPRDQSPDVRGGPVSGAHTLCQSMHDDVVVATSRTRSAAGGFVDMREFASPAGQQLFEVREIRHGRSRWQLRADTQLSPFIGREVQLHVLNKAWHDASTGEGQTVFLIGDPGLGKSRVTHEFIGAIPQANVENLEAGALETDLRSGFVVIRKVLQALFGVGDAEAPVSAAEKVLAAWATQGLDERLLAPIMATLELPVADPNWAAISGRERSQRMQDAVVALLLFLGRARPVVLLVEDLHWIDAESEAILARLAQVAPTAHLLLILTCRPEYDRGAFAAAGPAEIRLPALSEAEAEALLVHLVGSDPELDPLRASVTDACKGNALFLEETVRALAETGKLQGQPGRYRPSGKVEEIAVSASIQAIVDARFERLDADAKRLAEVASIFGGEIPIQTLQRMAGLSAQRFEETLQSLRRADILVDVQVFPEASVRFKHALIRTAVAGRIVSAARVELHKAALAELKSYYADRLEEHSERMARHAEQAHLWGEAADHLLVSARKAIRRSAHAKALEQLDLAIWLLRSNDVADADAREIELQLARGVALMAARGWSSTEVLAAYERAEELCGKIGDQARLFTALRGRAQYYMISGKPAAAQELASRWAGMARTGNDPGLEIETEHMFWTNNFFLGETATARDHAERAIGIYDPGRDHYLTYKYSGHDPGVCCRCFAGLSAWLGGEPGRARLRCEEAIGLATSLDHALSIALAHWGQSFLHILAGEPEPALGAAEKELEIAEQFQLPLIIGQAAFQLGWAEFRLGDQTPGLARMEQAISAIRQTGAEMGLPYFIGLHAEALKDCGRLAEAEKSIESALELGRHNGTYFQLAELLRIEALIREGGGASINEVEQMLRRAAEVAALQKSSTSQLRVAVELARRLRLRGDADRARALLESHRGLMERLGDSSDAVAAREI